MDCGTFQTASYRDDGEQVGSDPSLIYHFTQRGARQSIRGLSHSAFGPMYLVATTTSSYQSVRVVPPPVRA